MENIKGFPWMILCWDAKYKHILLETFGVIWENSN